ncbi:hypothetical protein MMC16_005739 [Acarospora aff. strigata]|nr:hypothetical protein [Acarospora aff. strigata]
MKAQRYPSLQTLSRRPGKSFHQAEIGQAALGDCTQRPLLTTPNRNPGVMYVVEHVTELQTPAQFANFMLNGKLPSGDQAASASYDWTSVFRHDGIFYKLNQGTTPEEEIFNAFGTSSEVTNLLILDAKTNSLKASAQTAFAHAYGIQQKVWQKLDGARLSGATDPLTLNTGSQPDRFTFQSQHKTYYLDFFGEFKRNIRSFLVDKWFEEIEYWDTAQAVQDFSAKTVGEIRAILLIKLRAAEYVSVKTEWLE